MQDYSFGAFTDFLHYLSDRGLIKGTTAQGYRVAASKIEDALTEQELADVRHIEVPTVFQRYANKNKLNVSPGTLRTYQGRLETALNEFAAWKNDPTGFRPRGPARKAKETRSKGAPKRRVSEAAPAEAPAVSPSPGPGVLNLPYPLRPDFLASVQVPRDLKAAEADRFAAFIKTLAIDYNPS